MCGKSISCLILALVYVSLGNTVFADDCRIAFTVTLQHANYVGIICIYTMVHAPVDTKKPFKTYMVMMTVAEKLGLSSLRIWQRPWCHGLLLVGFVM